MVPSSTVHFSWPTGTQPVRSFPLNSCTHCSLGYGARLRGTWGVSSAGTVTASRKMRVYDVIMLLRVHGVGVLCQIVLVAALPASVAHHSMEQAVRARLRGFAGTVSLYARNLDTGVALGIRESEPVRTASTIKLPIMLTVFDAVARGEAKWTDHLITDGARLPLRDVVHLMIEVSDNTAANMLLNRFTAEAVNACL